MDSFSSSKPCGGPPPPPPPPAPTAQIPPRPRSPRTIPATGPPGALLINLLIYNGAPFKDHWAYWIPSSQDPNLGIYIDAAGDVRNGFQLEVRRSYNLSVSSPKPTKQIPLQWVLREFVNEQAMLNHGVETLDGPDTPTCLFEASLFRVSAPGKSLRAVDDMVDTAPGRIVQRNCQTWIIESAEQAVRDGVFTDDVAAYLHAIEQV